MQINNGHGNTTTNWNQASSIQRKKNTSTSNPLNENKHSFGNVTLNWSDGAVFAYATPGGNSFSVYKDENYSSADPWLRVKGVDQQGNSYEERINAKEVLAKQNYMSILQEWRDMQQNMGNWAGYKKFSDVCNALSGFTK